MAHRAGMPIHKLQAARPLQSHQRNTGSVSNDSISNFAVIITAVSCLGGLLLVIGATLLLSRWMRIQAVPVSDTGQVDSGPKIERTQFQEGYSMILPSGFQQESREDNDRGQVVYRFRSEDGYRMTVAIISDESVARFSSPPQVYSEALVKSVPELSEGIEDEIQGERVIADGMPATCFRFYEKETYRGVVFTYFMVAIDRGTKLVLKIDGKYGGYDENAKNIVMPDHWYDSLLTLKRFRGR